MQSLKNLASMVSKKKLILQGFLNEEICPLSLLNMCDYQKCDIVMSYLIYLTIPWSFNLINEKMQISIKIVWHSCDLEIQSRALRVVWKGKAPWVVPMGTIGENILKEYVKNITEAVPGHLMPTSSDPETPWQDAWHKISPLPYMRQRRCNYSHLTQHLPLPHWRLLY